MRSLVVVGGTEVSTDKTKRKITWTHYNESNEEFTNRILDAIEARLEEIQDQKIYALLD